MHIDNKRRLLLIVSIFMVFRWRLRVRSCELRTLQNAQFRNGTNDQHW